MLPVKIITFEQAKKFNLIEKEENGSGVAAAGFVASKGPDGKETVTEKTIIKENGKKELIFMHEDRKKEMIKAGHFETYVKQFDVIEGEEKEVFLKKHLNIKESI